MTAVELRMVAFTCRLLAVAVGLQAVVLWIPGASVNRTIVTLCIAWCARGVWRAAKEVA